MEFAMKFAMGEFDQGLLYGRYVDHYVDLLRVCRLMAFVAALGSILIYIFFSKTVAKAASSGLQALKNSELRKMAIDLGANEKDLASVRTGNLGFLGIRKIRGPGPGPQGW